MSNSSRGYDTRCYDLAVYFLDDNPSANVSRLAQCIQDCIEDELASMAEEPEKDTGNE